MNFSLYFYFEPFCACEQPPESHEECETEECSHYSRFVDCTHICDEDNKPANCGARNGCMNLESEEHPCPYREEINDDHETTCSCCSDCTQECCYDI